MRVAVLSDIHGVLPALEAVLKEPDVASADLVVLTGDLATGPQPAETLDVLRGLGQRAVWVRGNADRDLVERRRGGRPEAQDTVAAWAAEQLRDDQVELLAELPLAASVSAVVCGHTHMPFVRLAHRRLVVNPGSIGMPYGGAGAHWALLGPGVDLRVTGFDLDRAYERIVAESGYPEAREWAEYFVRSAASDADALEVFGPRDGRDEGT